MRLRPAAGFTLLTLLAIDPWGRAAAASPPVEIVEHGEYAAGHENGPQRAPETSLGYVQRIESTHNPRLLRETEILEAELGRRFGIKVLIEGQPSFETVSMRVRVLHPPFRNPANGLQSDREEWDAELNIGIPRFTGWSFDEPWEMAPGRWTFQVLDGATVVAEQAFEIVASDVGSEAEDVLADWRSSKALERIPNELWERASVVVSGRYSEGRSPCIWVGEGQRRWVLMQGFDLTGKHLGDVAGDYVGVSLATSSSSPHLCAQCLVPGREYLLLLQWSPRSMEFLGAPDQARLWYNTLEGEEILGIFEIPASAPPAR